MGLTDPSMFDELDALRQEGPGSAPQIAVDYQAVTEQINPLIARAERALAALRLSVSASIELEPPENGWLTELAFRKDGKEWRLLVDIRAEDTPFDATDSKPLLSTSRETRLLALSKLAELEAELVKNAHEQMRGAAETVAKAEAFISALEARAK